MFLSGLDDIDRRLVELLIHNARMSYSDLGQAVGLSRVAVKARVRALEERGVIEEYTTIVNPQKISGAVSCYFELEVEPAQFSAVVDTLRASDTVTQIYQVSGRNKLHVHAVAAGQGELEDFLDRVIHRLPAGQANYAASKAGMIALAKSIAQELGSRGIRANAIAPGFILTDMTAALSDEVRAEWAKKIPLRRGGTPEDVANIATFLASDMSSYVSGQVIQVDGGMNM